MKQYAGEDACAPLQVVPENDLIKSHCMSSRSVVGSRHAMAEPIPHILQLTKARWSKFGMAPSKGLEAFSAQVELVP